MALLGIDGIFEWGAMGGFQVTRDMTLKGMVGLQPLPLFSLTPQP
jgi:hypothetical protein